MGVKMNSMPQIRLVFVLTKKDCNDFNRESVTRRLGILPSKTSAPTISKGRLSCDVDIYEIEEDLSGISILPAEAPPYRMMKHAFWSIETPKIECWGLDKPLKRIEQILVGKEAELLLVCKDYNLSADLIVRVFAESNNMPELAISNDSLTFWTSLGASIGFDFYLD